MTADSAATESRRRVGPAEQVWVTSIHGERVAATPDDVAGEEPLEIRLAGPGQTPEAVAVTMRTPGNDFELAVGFLLGEGLLDGSDDLRSVRYCDGSPGEPQRYNIVTVTSRTGVDPRSRRRAFTVNASCGICGTASLDQLAGRCPLVAGGTPIELSVLTALPGLLRRHQRLFDRTGGLHAAGLFDCSGRTLAVREDIGRHNALDKLVGWAAMQRRLPLTGAALVVSGRVSFEIVQKAAVAGIPILAAVSAPSSLAVATARRLGITLAGFVRDGRANLYAGTERVLGVGSPSISGP